ncbi:MAG: ABC transporter permease [Candidatus Woesearchaeota archaeon]|jgi:putative ABC transport system permease protein
MIIEYLKLALRSLTRRKLRAWLTMIGIFIGIAAVVSLIGLGEGLRTAITSQFGFLGPDVLTVQASGMNFAGPPGTAVPNPLTKDLAKKIESVNGVDVAINRYIAIGTLEFNNIQGIGFATSIPSGEKRKQLEEIGSIRVQSGRLLKDGDNKAVVIGSSFTKTDNGFGRPIKVGDKILLNEIQFDVIGILETRGSFTFDMAVIINENVMLQDFNKDENSVNIIAVKVEDLKNIEKTRVDIEKLLRKERDVKVGEEDFTVQSPQKALESLNSALFAVQLFVIIIATISLVVGGIGIMNTMYTSVLERTKEIGILKSIGAQNNAVFLLFAFESGLLGLVGGLIGIFLGVSLAYGLAAVGRIILGAGLIQAKVTLPLIIMAISFSFVIGLLAGVFPALKASRQKPVDSLRHVK